VYSLQKVKQLNQFFFDVIDPAAVRCDLPVGIYKYGFPIAYVTSRRRGFTRFDI
jgi:hypothetical protein